MCGRGGEATECQLAPLEKRGGEKSAKHTHLVSFRARVMGGREGWRGRAVSLSLFFPSLPTNPRSCQTASQWRCRTDLYVSFQSGRVLGSILRCSSYYNGGKNWRNNMNGEKEKSRAHQQFRQKKKITETRVHASRRTTAMNFFFLN